MADNIRPNYYRVEINGTPLVAVSAGGGFMDHVEIEEYGRAGAYPSTLELAEDKARANYRYNQMLIMLGETQSFNLVLDIDNGGATEDSPGSSFAFTIVYEREDYVYTRNELKDEPGHATEGVEIIEGEDAIKRQIARLFAGDFLSRWRIPRDPNLTNNNPGYKWINDYVEIDSPLVGTYAEKIDLAEAEITVTKILHTYNP